MKAFTIDDIQKLKEEIDNAPTVYMNRKTHEAVLEQLDFIPANIEVSSYIPDNQAIVMTKEQKERMSKGIFDTSFRSL